jgi:hypothetical protein
VETEGKTHGERGRKEDREEETVGKIRSRKDIEGIDFLIEER